MRFLRRRGDTVEAAWMSDRWSAVEKERALTILGGAVVLVRHPYERHPQSGSGNCWCGRWQDADLHLIVEEA